MLNSQVALYRLALAAVTLKASILTVWNFNGIFNSAPKKLIVPLSCSLLSDESVNKLAFKSKSWTSLKYFPPPSQGKYQPI